jgi:hypothetical protein
MVVSATFAWFRFTTVTTNHLETAQSFDGTVTLVEVFDPPAVWEPGQTVTKQASVANNGGADVFVRVSFEEALSLLGTAKDSTAGFKAGDKTVPQFFNTKGYLSDPEWKEAKTVFSGSQPTLPAGVTLRVKAVKDAQGAMSYAFATWSDISVDPYKGKAQRVTADFKVAGNDLSASNVKFWAFDQQAAKISKWSSDKPASSALTSSVADPGSPKQISFAYGDLAALQNKTPQAGKWWYNPADGYFYYIGRLQSGSLSPLLLKSVALDAAAGSEYAGLSYDLTLNMDVMQPLESALTSAQGWGLDASSPVLAALKPLCL